MEKNVRDVSIFDDQGTTRGTTLFTVSPVFFAAFFVMRISFGSEYECSHYGATTPPLF